MSHTTQPGATLHAAALVLSAFFIAPAQAVDFTDGGQSSQPIINGTTSIKGAQPWIAALARKIPAYPASLRQSCTGAVVDRYWVITAAHCLHGMDPEDYEVIIGRDDLDSTAGEVLEIAEVIPDPFHWDIGLIRLKSPSVAKPLAMASATQEETWFGRSLTVYGWGSTSWKSEEAERCAIRSMDGMADAAAFSCQTYVFQRDDTLAAHLQQTSVTLQTYTACNERFQSSPEAKALDPSLVIAETTTPNILCAWDPLEKSTPCFGDSGGPLVAMDSNNMPVLVGITSFGYVPGCKMEKQIGAYARVALLRSYLFYRMGGDRELGFAQLCPRQVEPTVSMQALADGQSRVEIRWDRVEKASGYQVFYTLQQNNDKNIKRLALDSSTTSLAVTLPAGTSYHVKVQARGHSCDGPMSELLAVVAP
jgi:secreted trypsin-like serine protease